MNKILLILLLIPSLALAGGEPTPAPPAPAVRYTWKHIVPDMDKDSFWMAGQTHIGGASGGTSVSVGGSTVANPNFNNTTPAAQGGFVNNTFQVSGSNISSEFPIGGLPAGTGVCSADTGAPCWTFGTNTVGSNVPTTVAPGSINGVGFTVTGSSNAGHPHIADFNLSGGSGGNGAFLDYLGNFTAVGSVTATTSLIVGTAPGGSAGTGSVIFMGEGTAPTGASGVDAIYANSANHCMSVNNNNADVNCIQTGNKTTPTNIYRQTASVTVSNTTTATTILGAGITGTNINANTAVAGTTIRIDEQGYASTGSGNFTTIEFQVLLGSTVICDSGAQQVPPGNSSQGFEVFAKAVFQTIGGGGTVSCQGAVDMYQNGATQWTFPMVSTGVTTINTTVNEAFDLKVTWGVASANNTITATNGLLEIL